MERKSQMTRAKHIRNALCLTMLVVFSTAAFSDDQPALEKNTARIRLFGQNAVMVKYYPNSKCAKGDSVAVSGGLGDAFSSFLGTVKSQSIGIPETPNTKNMAARDGVLSKAYFREYEIVAGQPMTIAMGFREAQAAPPAVLPVSAASGDRTANMAAPSGAIYCRTIATTFVPEKGKDYEAALDIRSSEGVCVQTIHEVNNTPGGVVLTPVAVARAEICN